jgi:hypothetical protein
MNPLAIAAIVFGCSYAAALLGMFLHHRLPEHHLDADSRDVLKLVMGLVATMAALVLGLLVAAANASQERQLTELRTLSADIILLDRTLTLYGPGAQTARDALHYVVRHTHDAIWSPTGVRPENLNAPTVQHAAKATLEQVVDLPATTEREQMLKGHAFEQADGISKSRLLMFESFKNPVSWPLLAVLICWITILFLGFGLLARVNATVAVAQLLGAISIAGAIFLILELGEPYVGLMKISDQPLLNAIAQIER